MGILDKRGKGKKIEYLVRWKTKPDDVEDETWELLQDLSDFNDIIEIFEKNFEEKNKKNTTSDIEVEEPTSNRKREAESSESEQVLEANKKQKTLATDSNSVTTKVDYDNNINGVNTVNAEQNASEDDVENSPKPNSQKLMGSTEYNQHSLTEVEEVVRGSVEDAINIIFNKE